MVGYACTRKWNMVFQRMKSRNRITSAIECPAVFFSKQLDEVQREIEMDILPSRAPRPKSCVYLRAEVTRSNKRSVDFVGGKKFQIQMKYSVRSVGRIKSYALCVIYFNVYARVCVYENTNADTSRLDTLACARVIYLPC